MKSTMFNFPISSLIPYLWLWGSEGEHSKLSNRRTTFWVGRSNSSFLSLLSWTLDLTRTQTLLSNLSLSVSDIVTTASGHSILWVSRSLTKTTSPTLKFLRRTFHFSLCRELDEYSSFQRDQNCSEKIEPLPICMHTGPPLQSCQEVVKENLPS